MCSILGGTVKSPIEARLLFFLNVLVRLVIESGLYLGSPVLIISGSVRYISGTTYV